MRLRQIEIFYHVYRAGSISGAARDLNVSQPSVSKVLRHAEDQLGFDLFVRRNGRLVATPAADELFVEAEDIYGRLSTFNRSLENIRNRNDLVLVGPAGVGKDYLASALLNQLTLKFRNARHHFRYIDGIDLRNDLMEAKTSDFASYPARIAHYAGYHLLYVSDPFPQKAQLSDFERGAIFDVLEKRQHTGCNIFTCNATDYAQLCDQIGEANASRIFDGATVVPCDWQSFRQPTLFVECN